MTSKYGNRKVFIDGYKFDSAAEARRYEGLKLAEQGGVITALKIHPKYLLQAGFRYKGKYERPIYYEADFAYVEGGKVIVEDVKGKRTAIYLLKRKLFLAKYSELDFREIEAKAA